MVLGYESEPLLLGLAGKKTAEEWEEFNLVILYM